MNKTFVMNKTHRDLQLPYIYIYFPPAPINMLHMIIPFAQAVGALFGMLGTQSYIDDIGPPMLPLGFIAFSAKGKFPLYV